MPTYDARKEGVYTGYIYKGCTEKTVIDRETGEERPAWVWRFQDPADELSTGEIAKFTNTSLQSKNSNAYKMAAGIMGRPLQPGDDTEVNIGKAYDIVYGPNQAGTLGVTSVIASKAAAPAPSPLIVHDDGTPAGTLPELP